MALSHSQKHNNVFNIDLDINDKILSDPTEIVSNCQYYDPWNLNSKLQFTDSLAILHVNIRSLQKNIHELLELISDTNTLPDIIAVTEIRIKDKPILNIDITDYRFLFVKSFNNAGGVGVYICKNLNYALAEKYNLPLPSCKNTWLNININHNTTYVIGIIYRHPHSTETIEFIDQLDQTLQGITYNAHKCMIMGDFNINLLSLENAQTASYQNMLSSNEFFSIANKPT